MQINNNLSQNFCPLCKSDSIVCKGRLAYRGTVKFSTNEIELSHNPELWKCEKCLSGFVQNIVDADTAKMLYSTGQSGNRWSAEAFVQNKMDNVIHNVTSIFGGKGNVLDVGCNTGELLDFAKEFGCKTYGLEFSSESRNILIDKGHSAYSTFEETKEKYDVITAFDLVEHLYDVPAFLKQCHDRLTDNGKLVILTGDIESLDARLSGVLWWYAQFPEHIVFPSKKYFSKYSGFHIERWTPTYASRGYKSTLISTFFRAISSLSKGSYTGLPSIGTDHSLIVLRK